MPKTNITQFDKHGGKLPYQPKILNVSKHGILIYSLLDQASTLLNQASTSHGHIKHDEVSVFHFHNVSFAMQNSLEFCSMDYGSEFQYSDFMKT